MIKTLNKERLIIPKAPYINKFPLGDENKTDWKGLEQYLSYLYGENDNDRSYALREVGNIFPKWVPIGPSLDDIPPYIPRVKDMVAVKYKGYDAWHPYGIMTREERMAILKRYTGSSWVSVATTDTDFKYRTSTPSWDSVKFGKYYDGANWQPFWTLVPANMAVLTTSSLTDTGWSDYSSTIGARWIMGYTGGYDPNGTATSHTHSNVTVSIGTVILSDRVSVDAYSLGLKCGLNNTHGHPSTSHNCSSQLYYPSYVEYQLWKTAAAAESIIPSGSLCFWSGTSANVPSGWTYISAKNGYHVKIVSSATGSTGASYTTPGHQTTTYCGTGSTGETSAARSGATSVADGARSHNHSMNSNTHMAAHDHSGVTAAYFSVILMSADSDTCELPVNGVTIFTGAPNGPGTVTWSRVTSADSKLLKVDSAWGSTGGTTSHTHDHTGAETYGTNIASNSRDSSTSDINTIKNIHRHTLGSGTHPSTAWNSMPAVHGALTYERTA